MKAYLWFTGLLLMGSQVSAQTCDCLAALNMVITKVETNHPGFSDRVTTDTQARYQLLVDSLRKQAPQVNILLCKEILDKYTSFFQDPHLGVVPMTEDVDKQQIRKFFADWPRHDWSEEKTKAYLNQSKRDSIEGIWEQYGGSYKVGIVKEKGKRNSFVGFIIKADSMYWMPGQIKMRVRKTANQYQITFYKTDHLTDVFTAPLGIERFQTSKNSVWTKMYPAPSIQAIISSSPRFEKLNAEANLLVFPSFNRRYKKEADSLLKLHREDLLHTPLLIVDLRNNSGGSVTVFDELVPYLYTHPMLLGGGSALATNDIIDEYESALKEAKDSTRKKEYRDVAAMLKANLEANPGKLVNVYPPEPIQYDTVLPFPTKVAVLINNGTASSGELFLERAQQSRKVVTFGQSSRGAIDYLNITDPISLPCFYYGLIYPTVRQDNVQPGRTGRFLPMVPIDNLPANQWVPFVLDWYKTHPDSSK